MRSITRRGASSQLSASRLISTLGSSLTACSEAPPQARSSTGERRYWTVPRQASSRQFKSIAASRACSTASKREADKAPVRFDNFDRSIVVT